MKIVSLTKDRNILVGNLFVLVLLLILPFTREKGGLWMVFQWGDLSRTLWNLRVELPILNVFASLLVLNAILFTFDLENRWKGRLLILLNGIGVVLFFIQFAVLRPEIWLGIGSFLLLFAFLLTLANGLSRLGLIRGDTFVSGSILTLGLLLAIFILFPLAVILTKSIVVQGAIKPANFVRTLLGYASTGRILKNSILMALSVGILSTAIGLAFALVVARSRFGLRRFMYGFSLLPIITPPFVIGLAVIFMFGRVGFLTNRILGLRTTMIFGYPGIVLAQTLSFTPMAFLVLVGVVRSLDTALEEASYTLGASRWHSFRTIIWPLIRPGIANAFLLSMIQSLADFANPILLGGDFDVLATSIYFAIIGRYDEVLAASLGLVLLSFTLTAFLLQRYWVGKRSYITVTGKPSRYASLPLPKIMDAILVGFTLVWVSFTLILYGSVIMGGFVKLWGINHTFTLMHYKRFLSDGLESYITTLKLASLSAPLTAAVGLLIAYLVTRYRFFGKRPFEFTSMLSFAIPGTVIGIGYIMAFNVPPLVLTGTAAIIVICFIFRNMPVGIRAGMAALQQIDPALEEASITLGAGNLATFKRIVLPLIRPAILSGLVFSFVRAMTAISAVIFLITARTKLATTVILGRIEAGKLGLATAYSTILIVTMIAAIGLMYFVVQRMGGHRRVSVM